MSALVLVASAPSVSLSLALGGFLLGGWLLGPQPWRRVPRLAGFALALALSLVTLWLAGPWICPYQGTWAEFLCYVP